MTHTQKKFLVDEVFSWSLDDILNEDFFLSKVHTIPETFDKVEQYYKSFIYPLLEETRAELSSSLENISTAPYAEVISVVDTTKQDSGKLVFDVKIDYWRNKVKVQGQDPYRTLPGDVFLITDVKPETVSDLQQFGRKCSLVSLNKIVLNLVDDDNFSASSFQVRASNEIEVVQRSRLYFVVFLMNITTNKRIWNSLHSAGSTSIINSILSPNNTVDVTCKHSGPRWSSSGHEEFNGTLCMLNESQRGVVRDALCKVDCEHRPSVNLVWGPPGTGKTKTLSTLLLNLLKNNRRVLVCAPTNIAVAEVASRVLKMMKDSPDALLGNVLLFGSKDWTKFSPNLEEIDLDSRIKRLEEVLGVMGWRHSLAQMIHFFKDCVSDYDLFLENARVNKKTIGRESFVGFLKDRFQHAALPLRRCIGSLCTHLPKGFLDSTLKAAVLLSNLLESFESLLSACTTASFKSLRSVFSQTQPPCSMHADLNALQLQAKRNQCLEMLERLLSGVYARQLPTFMNRDAIMDFCFQNASLIFCTASSTFRLLSVNMKPLNYLVIDEAAQLKECESTIPLQLNGVCDAILFGDQCQLPAMVNSRLSAKVGFGRSLFERLSLMGHSKYLLKIQYRMHPSISSYPNWRFYANRITNGPNVIKEDYERKYLCDHLFGPYSFINVSCGREEIEAKSNSYKNMVEVAIVVKLVQKLFKAWSSRGSNDNLIVGVVSPYSAQVVAIQEKIGQKYSNNAGFSLKVKSIDGFQGAEVDVVLLSTVRSNDRGAVGFISNLQRANVALTRARHCLWIFGDAATLSTSNSIWKSIVQDAKKRNCFHNAEEDDDLSKVVLEVKKELDQFVDLLKADSFLFKNSRWKVLFSDDFKKSFEKLKSSETKVLIINLLLRLSSGWRPRKWKMGIVSDTSSEILKQFKVKDLCVVLTVDVIEETNWIQVLKFWNILPLEDVPKLVNRLDVVIRSYTDEYLSRCKEKVYDGDLEIPMSWNVGVARFKSSGNSSNGSSSGCHTSADAGSVERCRVSESLLLMKFYSLSSGVVSQMLAGCDGREMKFPFELTRQEKEIVHFDRSSFVLGRSGTGKTTVLVMKLFQREQLHHIALEGFHAGGDKALTYFSPGKESDEILVEDRNDNLRQMYIAVSCRLCSGVKQHISSLQRSACGWNSSEESSKTDGDEVDDMSQFSEIPNSFINLPSTLYPLVISFNKFVMMLNGTITNSFFGRFPEIRRISQRNSSQSLALRMFIREKEVTYNRFCSSYWPKFSQLLTKKLDPSIVFTQIISHIKGGSQAWELNSCGVSKKHYVSLSEARISNLNEKERENVYDIFLLYEKKKKENGEFDSADIVLHLYQQLKAEGYKGDMMDFVYVDEVQDLTMREVGLLKYVCRNFEEGFIFAGDTAQTIVKGVDFRFEDVRSLFYREFIVPSTTFKTHGKEKKGLISDNFHLSENFRTHNGILKLGNSIINLLYHFFPLSIDVLNPEKSLICGEQPLLLVAPSDLLISSLRGSGNGKKLVYFGAEQVILVKDEVTKTEVVSNIGNQALVLTILECKGLEFQDVLLYNFFSSSLSVNEWEIVYGYMQEQNLLRFNSVMYFPKFNRRHWILCLELKQLYVAITRARQRLWIFENDGYSNPIFEYWESLGLVKHQQVEKNFLQEIQVPSSPEEWKSRGLKLFYQKNYEAARTCFEKAGEFYWENLSEAAHLRSAADSIQFSNLRLSRTYLSKAAQIYESIGKHESAAECFFELKEYEKAGTIYLEIYGDSNIEEAGECFLLAGCYEKAAELYSRYGLFSNCLSACISGKLFDRGWHFTQLWKEQMNSGTVMTQSSTHIDKLPQGFLENELQQFLERGAIYFHKLRDYGNMMKFVKSFNCKNQMRALLMRLNCLEELLSLEIEWHNFLEGANIASLIGDVLLEADLLEKAGKFQEASMIILSYVFMHSIWVGKGWPLKPFTNKDELLAKATSLARNVSNNFFSFVSEEAHILGREKWCLFDIRQSFVHSSKSGSIRGQMLCARRILDLCNDSSIWLYQWKRDLVDDKQCYEQNRTSWNHIGVATLVYFWNFWKEKIERILEYLEFSREEDSCGEFCLNYLGVKKQLKNEKITYLLLVPKAEWLTGIDLKLGKNGNNSIKISAPQFRLAAQRYWSSELISVGTKTFEKLESLYQFSVDKLLSNYCQDTLLIYITELLRFFSQSRLIDIKLFDPFMKLVRSFSSKGSDLKWGDKQLWILLACLRSEKDAHQSYPFDAKDKLSESILLTKSTMRDCYNFNYHRDLYAELIDDMKSGWEVKDETEVKYLVKKLLFRRRKIEHLIENVAALADIKDGEADTNVPGRKTVMSTTEMLLKIIVTMGLKE